MYRYHDLWLKRLIREVNWVSGSEDNPETCVHPACSSGFPPSSVSFVSLSEIHETAEGRDGRESSLRGADDAKGAAVSSSMFRSPYGFESYVGPGARDGLDSISVIGSDEVGEIDMALDGTRVRSSPENFPSSSLAELLSGALLEINVASSSSMVPLMLLF